MVRDDKLSGDTYDLSRRINEKPVSSFEEASALIKE